MTVLHPNTSPLEAARSVLDTLATQRDEARRNARMTRPVARAVGSAGLFALAAPTGCGGLQATLRDIFEVCETLAEVDPGVAWHVANSVVAGMCGGSLGDDDARMLFGDPAKHFGFSAVPGGVARPGTEGWTLHGRWPFVTGSLDAGWMGLTARVTDADGAAVLVRGVPQTRTFFVRRADVTVEHTWGAMAAMRSSGSNAVSADGALSPDALSYSFVDPRPVLDHPLYHLAPYQVFWTTAIGVLFGIWSATVTAAAETVGTKRSSFDAGLAGELASVQSALAEADITRRAWRAAVLDGIDGVWVAASRTGTTTAADRGPLWGAMLLASDRAREHGSRLMSAGTTQAWAAEHPLNRAVADAHAVTIAFERFRPLLLDVGRSLAGLDPQHPLF